MLQLQREHEQEDSGGKQLHHVAQLTQERPGPSPDRKVLDLVTDDFSVYRFSQLSPGDPWTFEPGQGFDNRMSRSGRLPGSVEEYLDDRFTDENDDPEPGWQY